MKKIINLIMIFSVVFMLKSCFPNGDVFRSKVCGDFVYSHLAVSDPKNDAAIIGLSEEGKKKETIIFPTSIDGYNVEMVGTYFFKRKSGPIIFTNAKNIYLTNLLFKTSIKFEYNDITSKIKIYVGSSFSSIQPDYSLIRDFSNSQIYVSQIYYEKIKEAPSFYWYNYVPANVIYYLGSYSKDTFFVDDADGTPVNVIPPDPKREGYKFDGWYKDIKGTIPWDFEKDVVPKKIYDTNGEYIFAETKIYAKWIKK